MPHGADEAFSVPPASVDDTGDMHGDHQHARSGQHAVQRNPARRRRHRDQRYGAIWHERVHHDPGIIWLRDIMARNIAGTAP